MISGTEQVHDAWGATAARSDRAPLGKWQQRVKVAAYRDCGV